MFEYKGIIKITSKISNNCQISLKKYQVLIINILNILGERNQILQLSELLL